LKIGFSLETAAKLALCSNITNNRWADCAENQ